jgi:hypothetical protein
MTRRTGQAPKPSIHRGYWTVRYWIDVPGQHARIQKRERICPVTGPGALREEVIKKRAMEIIINSKADTAEHLEMCETYSRSYYFP